MHTHYRIEQIRPDSRDVVLEEIDNRFSAPRRLCMRFEEFDTLPRIGDVYLLRTKLVQRIAGPGDLSEAELKELAGVGDDVDREAVIDRALTASCAELSKLAGTHFGCSADAGSIRARLVKEAMPRFTAMPAANDPFMPAKCWDVRDGANNRAVAGFGSEPGSKLQAQRYADVRNAERLNRLLAARNAGAETVNECRKAAA